METKAPLFSIITVTFNAEKLLERTISSVFQQSYPDIEYIIIDGVSQDGTLDIIKRHAGQLAYWVSEPDKGLYDAMNKGLQQASGDYLLFLNAGDTLQRPDTIVGIAEVAQKNQLPDILYGETDLVDREGRFIAHRRLKAPEQLNWKSFRMGMLVCHQAFIVKRTLAPLYDLKYHYSSDFDWCIRCMKMAGNIQNTHLCLVNYLNEGLTASNRKRSLKERYRIMISYYGRIPVFLLHFWFAIRFYWAKWVKRKL